MPSRFGAIMKRSLAELKGVGPTRLRAMADLGITTVYDLLTVFPRRYEDRRQITQLGALRGETLVTVQTRVLPGIRQRRTGRVTVTQVPVADDTGKALAIWFNQPYMAKNLQPNRTVTLTGTAQWRSGSWQIAVREYSLTANSSAPGIIPFYRVPHGVSQKLWRDLIQQALLLAEQELLDQWPTEWLAAFELPRLASAFRALHFPRDWQELARGRARLIFDELMILRLTQSERRLQEGQAGHAHDPVPDLLDRLVGRLPFGLTKAQKRAIDETLSDMESPSPMRRLLQGDVGSGKTVVAAAAILKAAASGRQAVLLAPTELLAEQHHRTLTKWLQPLGIEVTLLSGGMKAKDRSELVKAVSDRRVPVIVGTHAILQETVEIPELSLVVVDEQHRFGVAQRRKLLERVPSPDLLAISATPIPRSLALVLYGEMAVSVLDEIPPGRTPIKTYWIGPEREQGLLDFCCREMAVGHQIYWVCPSIASAEDDGDDASASVEGRLSTLSTAWSSYRVAALHGKMTASEKDHLMRAFARGEVQAIVATTVIEVGVDVPSATVMVIEEADRFGLAQLHQLRGRVGRGTAPSYCALLGTPRTKEAEERLRTIEKTTDGFVIAQADLTLRGPGEVLGTSQHGFGDLLVNQWQTDWDLVERIGRLADEVIAHRRRLDHAQWQWVLESARERFTSSDIS